MLFERTFPHHSDGLGFVITFVVLRGADSDVVAGLKIADLCVAAGSVRIFGGAGGRDGGNSLLVRLDDDVFVVDFAEDTGERGCSGLVVTLASRLLTGSGISSSSRIIAAGIPDAWAADNLSPNGKASQQNQGWK